ncbi:ABC transporter ATP-binding protein [Brucepastera parasyntrophica]|uniref:ABC transporter ATP-binding protein n=1 Tax=Brucepastera parasyntrophica TaxID=2880008 RepID=UPI00210B8887|nr:ABC transporter ATP-binding protein [Brucepastera parasyntrophica]ULQ58494.1 ABC transporter ATP-binding protein [Brucepastera parasyntrophica]
MKKPDDLPGEKKQAEVLLKAENLYAGYSGRRHRKGKDSRENSFLKNITFSLHKGERLCIIGPNGSGKTTLLRVLAGILPYSGSCELAITDPFSPDCGRALERAALPPDMAARETAFLQQLSFPEFSYTVGETVWMGLYAGLKQQRKIKSGNRSEYFSRTVADALKLCGIEQIYDKTLDSLSGGQLQRVFFARTLVQEPAVLLMDEPANHLDLFYQIELLNHINTWVRGGNECGTPSGRPRAAIGVFHDLSLALYFADTLILMNEGCIADYGPPRAVIHGNTIRTVYNMDIPDIMRKILQKW